MREGVDCAILETGIGGEYDATNIVERPVATGITTLGIDHVFALGGTIEEIAWHKAGIMKKGSEAFTVEQVEPAARVLSERAKEKFVQLRVAGVDPRMQNVKIRPDALFQKKNASLAVALAETALTKIDVDFRPREDALPQAFVDGLEQVVWRGRCEVKVGDGVTWHLDGAHTTDSLKMASRWFVDDSADRAGPRVLIFNQQGRTEAIDFLRGIHEVAERPDGSSFDHVIFCTNVTYATGYKRGKPDPAVPGTTDFFRREGRILLTIFFLVLDFVNNQFDPKTIEAMTVQRTFAEKWQSLDPKARVSVKPTIQEALEEVQGLSKDVASGESVQAFITGSLHLVGGALGILEGADAL